MIRGEKTRLRALEHDDLPHFVRWVNDPQVRRFLAMRYPLSMTEEENWWQNFTSSGNDFIFAIDLAPHRAGCVKDDDKIFDAGRCGL